MCAMVIQNFTDIEILTKINNLNFFRIVFKEPIEMSIDQVYIIIYKKIRSF